MVLSFSGLEELPLVFTSAAKAGTRSGDAELSVSLKVIAVTGTLPVFVTV
jgi:hypothetical protein